VKKYLFILFIIFFGSHLFAQECNIKLAGIVKDKSTKELLPNTNVRIEKTTLGSKTDKRGFFSIKNICTGDVHLIISHVGCENKIIFFKIEKDTFIEIELEHHTEFLHEVHVNGKNEKIIEEHLIGKKEIQKNSGKTFSQLAELIPGVSISSNGANINKPIINGLSGNRITILNNGIPQAGQQWGSDHAPEIDPLQMQQLTIIKGVGGFEYGSNGMSGIINASSLHIGNDPHLHGKIISAMQSNGRGGQLSLQVEQKKPWIKYRIGGTYKKLGDRKTPDYFLTNTGVDEKNFSIQLEKNIKQHWKQTLNYSLFSTNLGILRGAHIGNLNDLEEAIQKKIPFFTDENFNYSLSSPRQNVMHHLFKTESTIDWGYNKLLKITWSTQFNNRKEFDVRRGGRENIPALSLQLWANQLGIVYNKFSPNFDFKLGTQTRFTQNSNNAETGIKPLIPNYTNFMQTAFAGVTKNKGNWKYELGAKTDLTFLKVYQYTQQNIYEEPSHLFFNVSGLGGLSYYFTDHHFGNFNWGISFRNPEVNELYSNGLHQGVSGIEEGNRNLKPEMGNKFSYTHHIQLNDKFFIETSVFAHQIQNYIFLQAQPDFRLTIRGAFPVFKYKQTNALLLGFDFLGKYQVGKNLYFLSKINILKGQDVAQNIPLVYMPANNFSIAVHKQILMTTTFIKQTEIFTSYKYVMRQNRLLPFQDFLKPPPSFGLVNSGVETKFLIKDKEIFMSLQCDNIFNVRYRDYLNRLRYFADEMGRNFTLRCVYQF
jgi:iron complex outermembrane receptor protein